jgi:hypothetical protein
MGREVNAEQMIKNIEERKTGILENIALRNTKLNETPCQIRRKN